MKTSKNKLSQLELEQTGEPSSPLKGRTTTIYTASLVDRKPDFCSKVRPKN